jgi:response regulator of citrate/malate metabolism
VHRCNAFIVEDSAVIAENLIATLEEVAGVEVVGTAPDEQTAARWLAAHRGEYGLVVIDIFLKRGSGLGVLQSAAEIGCAPALAVLTNTRRQPYAKSVSR